MGWVSTMGHFYISCVYEEGTLEDTERNEQFLHRLSSDYLVFEVDEFLDGDGLEDGKVALLRNNPEELVAHRLLEIVNLGYVQDLYGDLVFNFCFPVEEAVGYEFLVDLECRGHDSLRFFLDFASQNALSDVCGLEAAFNVVDEVWQIDEFE